MHSMIYQPMISIIYQKYTLSGITSHYFPQVVAAANEVEKRLERSAGNQVYSVSLYPEHCCLYAVAFRGKGEPMRMADKGQSGVFCRDGCGRAACKLRVLSV